MEHDNACMDADNPETAVRDQAIVRLREQLDALQTIISVFEPKRVTDHDNVGSLVAIIGDPKADGGIVVTSFIEWRGEWVSNCGERHAVRFLADAMIAMHNAPTRREVRERIEAAINWGESV